MKCNYIDVRVKTNNPLFNAVLALIFGFSWGRKSLSVGSAALSHAGDNLCMSMNSGVAKVGPGRA